MDSNKIHTQAAEIHALLAERLRIRAPDLAAAVRKAGRRLPRRLRRHASELVEADRLADHPRLRLQVDQARIARAHDALAAHLGGIDPAARRRAKILDFLAFVALVALVTGVGVVVWLRWRGLV